MRTAALLVCLTIAACGHPGGPYAIPVDFVNASKPTRCAEEDNVYVQMIGEDVRRFRIRAEHPPYIEDVREDSTVPDFTHCDMSADPSYPFAPRTVVLYENRTIRLVGHTFPTFWRPTVVSVRVGTRQESGLHLVQLVRLAAPGEIEILVVYPADGYWRLKPLPPHTLADTAYGSSFLFGPVEESGRPFVALREIVFDPERMRFDIEFADDRRGTLRVIEAAPSGTTLELAIDPPLPATRPFAALRSMYVAERQADVAIAAWRGHPGTQSNAKPILEFSRFSSPSARFGRVVPSRHNLSAPDLVFDAFRRAAVR